MAAVDRVECRWSGAFFRDRVFVNRGLTQNLDNEILRKVHELASRADRPGRLWGEESVVAITSVGAQVNLVCACVVVLGFLLFLRRWQLSVFIALSLLGAIGLNHWLKPFFGRARPDVVPHAQFVESASFPSGHAMISTAAYLALGLVGAELLRARSLKIYLLTIVVIMSFAIGLSRIYLGVHYPSDVLAGWILGLVWVGISRAIANLTVPADAALREK